MKRILFLVCALSFALVVNVHPVMAAATSAREYSVIEGLTPRLHNVGFLDDGATFVNVIPEESGDDDVAAANEAALAQVLEYRESLAALCAEYIERLDDMRDDVKTTYTQKLEGVYAKYNNALQMLIDTYYPKQTLQNQLVIAKRGYDMGVAEMETTYNEAVQANENPDIDPGTGNAGSSSDNAIALVKGWNNVSRTDLGIDDEGYTYFKYTAGNDGMFAFGSMPSGVTIDPNAGFRKVEISSMNVTGYGKPIKAGETVVFRALMPSTYEGTDGNVHDITSYSIYAAVIMSDYIAPGDYYLYNVGASQFMQGGNSWGTQASLANNGQLMTLEASGDGYTIDTHYSGSGSNHYLGENGYLDSKATVFTFEQYAGYTYAIKSPEGKYLYSDGTSIVKMSDTVDPSGTNAQWVLLNRAAIIEGVSGASGTNPVEITPLIYCAGFDRNNDYLEYWKGNLSRGGANDNMCAEVWNKDCDVYQTLTGLPTGWYQITCQGFYRAGNLDTESRARKAYIYANDSLSLLKSWFDSGDLQTRPNSMTDASAAFSAGYYSGNSVFTKVDAGTLKFGIGKSETLPNDWTIFDNFRLYYYGNGLPPENLVNDKGEAESAYNDEAKATILEYQTILATKHDEHVAGLVEMLDSVKTIYNRRFDNVLAKWNDSLQILVDKYYPELTLPAQLPTAKRYFDLGTAELADTFAEAQQSDANARAEITVRGYLKELSSKHSQYENDLAASDMADVVKQTYTAMMHSAYTKAQTDIEALIDQYSPELALQDHTDEANALLTAATEDFAAAYAQARQDNDDIIAGDNDAAKTTIAGYQATLATKHAEHVSALVNMLDSVKAIYNERLDNVLYKWTDSLQTLVDKYYPAQALPAQLPTAKRYLDLGTADLAATYAEAQKSDANARAEITVRGYLAALSAEYNQYAGDLAASDMADVVKQTYTAMMHSAYTKAQTDIEALVDQYSPELSLQDHTDDANALLTAATEDFAAAYAQARQDNDDIIAGDNDAAKTTIAGYQTTLATKHAEHVAALVNMLDSVKAIYNERLDNVLYKWTDSLQTLVDKYYPAQALPAQLPTAKRYLDLGTADLAATYAEAQKSDANARAELTVRGYLADLSAEYDQYASDLAASDMADVVKQTYTAMMRSTYTKAQTDIEALVDQFSPELALQDHTDEANALLTAATEDFAAAYAQARQDNDDIIAGDNDAAKTTIAGYQATLATKHAEHVSALVNMLDSVKAIYNERLDNVLYKWTDSLQTLVDKYYPEQTLPAQLPAAKRYLDLGTADLAATYAEAQKSDANARAEITVRGYLADLSAEYNQYVSDLAASDMADVVKQTYTAMMRSTYTKAQTDIEALIDQYSPELALSGHEAEAHTRLTAAIEDFAALYEEALAANMDETEMMLAIGSNITNTREGWHLRKFGIRIDDSEGLYSTLLNRGSMTADSVWVDDVVPSDQWTFVTMPFDVKIDSIIPDNTNVQFAVRRYDGAGRASGGTGDNWKRVKRGETLAAGEGFILQHNSASGTGCFTFPASEGRNNIFANADVRVALHEYPGKHRCNSGWNFVGNPYPTYYDMSHSDFTAPITIWNGEGYEAYRPQDDGVVLHPFQTFFVQKQGKEAIVFSAAGRQDNANKKPIKVKRNESSDARREIINLSVGNSRTRIVINEEASCGYELECDAAKFFGQGVDIYTIEDGTALAINERPLEDGIVSVGFSSAKAGTYTITSDRPVVLVDKKRGVEVVLDEDGYTFSATAGNTFSRFELRINGTADDIRAAAASMADDSYYTIDGVKMYNKPIKKGIYIRDGHKVVY